MAIKRLAWLVVIAILAIKAPVEALSIKESVDWGVKNNPLVVIAQKKLEAAEARLNQAKGAFLPTIKLDGSYGLSYTQPSAMQITTQTTSGAVTQNMTFGTDAQQNSKSIQASLNQPLFVAALFPGYTMAVKSTDLAKEDLRKAILETSSNVTQSYFSAIRAKKIVKVAEESLAMAESHLKQVQTMSQAGVSTRADLLRAEVQVANFEVGLTRSKNGLELAKDAFNNALGRELEQEVTIEETTLTGKIAKLPAYQELLAQALLYRPDWQQFNLATTISEENLQVAKSNYYPTVMLSASLGKQLTEYPSYNTDINSWRVTGAASWTLFDGLGIQNRINEAAANLEAQKATTDQVKNGIAPEVRDAYLNLKSALETIASTAKAVESATESNKVSLYRYSSGVAGNLEVIDAQVALTQARINNLQALYDVEVAKARINKVVGKEVL